MGLYLQDIVDNTLNFSANFTKDGFIYELLEAYGISKANITKMRQSKTPYVLNNKVHYLPVDTDLEAGLKELQNSPITKKKKSRFLITTDFTRVLAEDTKTGDTLDVALEDFFEEYSFFLPWTGREKVQVYEEVEADQKAAAKMAKLFDIIRIDNPSTEPEAIDSLNHFFTRLIFCYYAEDTGIFEKNVFTKHLEVHTDYDGSNTGPELRQIFKVLNTANNKNFLAPLQKFPYVNGGLFEQDYEVPVFSARARRMLIECGKIHWEKINPDIFGSMFQGVMDEEIRHELGAHYTSVPNIMKVINPLFMDDLREEFEKCKGSENKLKKLQQRIAEIKIFDPACGSGNFLITAYKELRHLEMDILNEIEEITKQGFLSLAASKMTVDHFYGIEINPFAVELAKLSIWLAEHQMNVEFQNKFSVAVPSIPLKNSARIVAANACRIDWEDVCPKGEEDEIYILGNPPYLGARQQSKEQKSDLTFSLKGFEKVSSCDYITPWFYKASRFIKNINSSKYAFVTTNSVCQGEQVSAIWPHILKGALNIQFAYKSFKWKNNAKNPAGVTCVIVGVSNKIPARKFLIDDHTKVSVKHINAYLLPCSDIYIRSTSSPISNLPQIKYGSFALDDGNYTLSKSEYEEILDNEPAINNYIKKFIGAAELIRGIDRYCLWLKESNDFYQYKIITDKVNRVKEWRENSTREQTRILAQTPHLFAEIRQPDTNYIAFPTVSSERREYIPIDYLDKDVIASNQIYTIKAKDPYIFSILTSKMHMVWVHTVGGRLKTDYRYSASICYNTFPIPNFIANEKSILEDHYWDIASARSMHPGKTLAELYDPDKMPENLRNAHQHLDNSVDKIYNNGQLFKNNEERLARLFSLYEEMTNK